MTNQQKLLQALADGLNTDTATLNDDSSPDTTPGWDSMAMVGVVAELERVFGVQFDILEIADFRSVAIIKSILIEKGIPF